MLKVKPEKASYTRQTQIEFERNRLRDKTVFEFAFYEHALIFHKLG